MKKDDAIIQQLTIPVPSLGQQMIRGATPAPATPGAIAFECSPYDMELIAKIVQRVSEILKAARIERTGYVFDPVICAADIANVHCNGMPLRLFAWLTADTAAFVEDFNGINRNVNRVSGGVNGEWRARYAEPKQ